MANQVEATTAQRKGEYGDWRYDGGLADKLICVVENSPGWGRMPRHLRQSLRMILIKVSRICCGNPRNQDSWHDIQGYALIAEQRLDGGSFDGPFPGQHSDALPRIAKGEGDSGLA